MAQDDNGLKFALTTTPAEPKCGEDIALHLTVNAIDGPVEISALLVAIPVGSTATDLTPVALPQNVPTKTPDGWNKPEITGGSTLHATPVGGGTVIIDDQGLEFSVGKDGPNTVLKWDAFSATTGTLTSSEGESWEVDGSGTHAVKSLAAQVTYTLTVANPKFPKPLSQQKDNPKSLVKTLGAFDWTRHAAMPDVDHPSAKWPSTASCIQRARTSPVIQRIRTIPTS